MVIRAFAALVVAFALLVSPSLSAAQSLDRALADSNPVSYIDRLPPQERARIILEVRDRVASRPWQSQELIDVLCEINSWTTGNLTSDVELQERLWALAAQEQVSWSDRFAKLDCAAANRTDFYYSNVVEPFIRARNLVCQGRSLGEFSDVEIETAVDEIEKVDSEVIRGLSIQSNSQRLRSFYPIRNAFRRATLEVAMAIRVADEDWSISRSHFVRAAEIIEEYNNPSLLKRSRNGWRFKNDIEVYSSLYRWLAGEEVNFEEVFARLVPVQKSQILDGAIDPRILQRMPSDYKDYIFVGRILPGAADSAEECSRWRDRSYHQDKFERQILDCTSSVPVTTIQELRDFDDCMAGLVADDWRVQFLAFFRKSDADNEAVAQEEIERVREGLAKLKIDVSDISLNLGVVEQGSYYVIRTPDMFTTSRIQAVRDEIRSVFDDVLFGRPTLF